MSYITACSVAQGNDFQTAQNAVDFLQDAFPGWEWTASCDGGMIYIKNLTLSERWGMSLRVGNIDKHQIIMSGGQILERFGMPSKMDKRRVAESNVDFSGSLISDKWTPDRRYFNKTEQRWKV